MIKSKFVFAVSFVSLMAVGVANAEIAATSYVDRGVKVASDAAAAAQSSANSASTAAGKAQTSADNAQDAADAAQESADAAAASAKTANDAVATKQPKSTAAYQMGNASGGWTAMTSGQQSALNSGVTSTTVSQVATNKSNIATNTANIATKEDLENKVQTISGTGDDTTYPTTKAVAGYATTLVNEVVTSVEGLDSDLADLQKKVDDNETDIEAKVSALTGTVNGVDAAYKAADTAINSKIGTVTAANMGTTAGTVVGAIKEVAGEAATAQSTADSALTKANAAVVGNAAITAGTATKITYDSKGLVTGGGALTADDIPTLSTSKISGLGSLATKNAVSTGDITDGTITNTDISTSAAIAVSKIGFSDAQESALDSGVTSATVSQVATNKSNIATNTANIATKQDKLTTSNIKGAGSVSVAITDGVITVTGSDENTTYSTGSATTSGLTKLYTATGSNTDGTMTQNAITNALGNKQDKSTIGTVSATNMGTTATTVVGAIKEVVDEAAAAQSTADSALTKANAAVVGNAAITAGTATKITYDSKGLVTGGGSLTAADIPTLSTSKISGLGSLATKNAVSTGDITDGTITNTDISTSAAIAVSKIGFSDAQESALDSGVTSATVSQVATNKSNIATNKSNIATNTANIATKEDLENKVQTISGTGDETTYPSTKAVAGYATTLVNEVVTSVEGLDSDLADLREEFDGLATVAKTGSYNDLSNKPAINNAQLTIKNGATNTNLATFTANSGSAATATIPAASPSVAGLAKIGVIPSGSETSTTYATIWVQ